MYSIPIKTKRDYSFRLRIPKCLTILTEKIKMCIHNLCLIKYSVLNIIHSDLASQL